MLVTVKINDDTYEKYGKHNGQNPRLAIEQVVDRFAEIGASGKAVVLSGKNLAELQKLVGQVDSPEGLVETIKKMVSISVNSESFPLSESQLKGVQSNSKFYGQSPEDFLKSRVKTALQNALGV